MFTAGVHLDEEEAALQSKQAEPRRTAQHSTAVCVNRRTQEEVSPPPSPPLSSVERRRTSETRKHAVVPLRPRSESELIREHFRFVSPSRPPAAEGADGGAPRNKSA